MKIYNYFINIIEKSISHKLKLENIFKKIKIKKRINPAFVYLVNISMGVISSTKRFDFCAIIVRIKMYKLIIKKNK